MPGRYSGTNQVHDRFLGAAKVKARYRGSTLIWTPTMVRDDFADPNQDLRDTGRWVDLGPSSDYRAAIVDGAMRLGLPDGLIVQTHRTSYARHTQQHTGDDGYIEVQLKTKGNGTPPLFSTDTYITEVFRRGNNTGTTATSGVGLRFRESRLFIVRRVGGNSTEMVDCGSFGVNDVVRMWQIGNIHTVYRNGVLVGTWNDAASSALKGSAYKSCIVRVEASKDLLGPRRFSPSLDGLQFR